MHYVASDHSHQLVMSHNEVFVGTLDQNQINQTWKIVVANTNHGWFK